MLPGGQVSSPCSYFLCSCGIVLASILGISSSSAEEHSPADTAHAVVAAVPECGVAMPIIGASCGKVGRVLVPLLLPTDARVKQNKEAAFFIYVSKVWRREGEGEGRGAYHSICCLI